MVIVLGFADLASNVSSRRAVHNISTIDIVKKRQDIPEHS